MTATGRPRPRETPARMARWSKSSREALRGRAGLLEGAGAQDAGDLLAVEGLPLEQSARQRVKLLDVLLEDLLGAARRLPHDPLDLRVDEEGGVLPVIFCPGDPPGEGSVVPLLP